MMNNATTYRQGYYTPNIQATIPTASAVGDVCRTFKTTKKPKRDTERPTQVRTTKPSTNGFLNTQFLPKTKVDEHKIPKTEKELKQIEKHFYKSLKQMAKHYKIKPIETQHLPYPNNLNIAYWDIKSKLKKHLTDNGNLHIVKTENKETFLGVSRTYETPRHLHYICIYTFYKMLKSKENKATNDLIISVFAYLYKKVGMPFFRDEDSYLYWLYDMLKDWMEEDEEEYFDKEDRKILCAEIYKMEYVGDEILRKISHENNLLFWEQRLQNFNIKTDFDKEVFEISEKFYKLWQDHPYDNVFNYIRQYRELNEDIMPMYKYLSFACFFDYKGDLYEHINQTINDDLANYGEMEEPTIYQIFNGNDIMELNFDFIHRLFTLLNELINLI